MKLLTRRAAVSTAMFGATALAAVRWLRDDVAEYSQETEFPIRDAPLTVLPVHDANQPVEDETLTRALAAALPAWNPPSVGTLLHALRLWGADSVFTPKEIGVAPVSSGKAMIKTLLDGRKCKIIVKGGLREFLVRTPFGIRILSSTDGQPNAMWSEGHYDQLLKVLADAAVPTDMEVICDDGAKGFVRELVADALARFHPSQEMDFTGASLPRWLHAPFRWTDRFGRTYSLDDVAESLLARELGSGSCGGAHLPFALVMLLRVAEEQTALKSSVAVRVGERVAQAARLLERNELPDGGWDGSWANKRQTGGERLTIRPLSQWPGLQLISFIGHHLEWIAFCPLALRPNRAVVAKAIDALDMLFRTLSEAERSEGKGYLPITHAARALTSIRGVEPYSFWKKIRAEVERGRRKSG